MKGEFSRVTFNPMYLYSGVLQQQRRHILDADWNEQVAIDRYHREIMARDIIGPFGVPKDSEGKWNGFKIMITTSPGSNENTCYFENKIDPALSFYQDKIFSLAARLKPAEAFNGEKDHGIIAGRFTLVKGTIINEYALAVNPDHTISFKWLASVNNTVGPKPTLGKDIITRELTTGETISDRQFSHLTATVDKKSVSIYINGHLSARKNTGNYYPVKRGKVFIGADSAAGENKSEGITRLIEEVALWDYHLTDEEVNQGMNQSLMVNKPHLIRLWRFNRGAGENVPDLSGHGEPIEPLGVNNGYGSPPSGSTIEIGKGRCYLNGILCQNDSQNDSDVDYTKQPFYPGAKSPGKLYGNETVLFYLDVWKRFITDLQAPHIREIALNGANTAGRTQTVWQVKAIPADQAKFVFAPRKNPGKMKAERVSTEGLRGNFLYRVEIHGSGFSKGSELNLNSDHTLEIQPPVPGKNRFKIIKWGGDDSAWQVGQPVEFFNPVKSAKEKQNIYVITDINRSEKWLTLDKEHDNKTSTDPRFIRRVATFKWSRDNGTLAFSIDGVKKETSKPSNTQTRPLGEMTEKKIDTLVLNDPHKWASRLKRCQWVEVMDDKRELRFESAQLHRIIDISETIEGNIEITLCPPLSDYHFEKKHHPLMRVWGQDDKQADENHGVIPVTKDGVELEEGIKVYFDGGGSYHTGDYWWIPARISDQGIQWPEVHDEPEFLSPHGIHHHYAPLAKVTFTEGTPGKPTDCRKKFDTLVDLKHQEPNEYENLL